MALGCSGFGSEVPEPAPTKPAQPVDPAELAIAGHIDAWVASSDPPPARRLVDSGVPLRIQVFDANATHALLQVVYRDADPTRDEPPAAPVDCAYPGMERWPLAGVALSVIELASGDAQTWEVYAPARWGDPACTSQGQANLLREAAEAAARAVGLDPSRRLAPIPREPPLPALGCHVGGDGLVRLPSGEVRTVERHGSDWGTHAFLVAGERIVYSDSSNYNPGMGGSATTFLGDAFPSGDGFTFLQVRWSFQGTCSAKVGLTPVVTL